MLDQGVMLLSWLFFKKVFLADGKVALFVYVQRTIYFYRLKYGHGKMEEGRK